MHSRGPAYRGTYLLLAHLTELTEITIGRLGAFGFPSGWYAYAGSALGPGGLAARLARHRRARKRLHWHIDYLLQHAEVEATWQVRSPVRLECVWAAAVATLPGARVAVPRFGASDCCCDGHLVGFCARPAGWLVRQTLSGAARAVQGHRQAGPGASTVTALP